MILLKLKGGLGNQLFQYACGRALSIRNNEELKLDITEYSNNNTTDVVRHYSLSHFNIKATIVAVKEIEKMKYPHGFISKVARAFRTKVRREFYINFNPNIIKRKGNIYLDGFFQTEKYFIDKEKEIRRDLTLKSRLNTKVKELSEKITNAQRSVSLHVRRGDYVNHPVSNKYNGTCSVEYYRCALDIITKKVGAIPKIFIFSDDIDWVRENMPFPYPTTYVSSPEIKDYEELHLMSLCHHHIIANSSFSWWGAWLDPRSDKIVVAPKRWTLKNVSRHRDTVPSSWIKI